MGSPKYDPQVAAEAQRKGGHAIQATRQAYRWTSEAAKVAGRRGGQATAAKRRPT
jgi:general stress protein YciG